MRLISVIAAGGLLAATLPQGVAATAAGSAGAGRGAPPVRTVTKMFDVDGDARADRVTLAPVRAGRFLLTVTTARGRTARVPVWSTFAQDWGENPWVNQGGIDGVPGSEIVLAVSGGDGVSAVVLTWRRGKLVNLKAPANQGFEGPARDWYWIGDDVHAAGYRFWTAGGVRKAAACNFTLGSGKWRGAVTTSHWTSSGWRVRASSSSVVAAKTARACVGLNGVTPAR